MSAYKPDKVDAKIMQVLSTDGRISWRDLADKIGLSLTPTLRRLRRLESEGVITGYSKNHSPIIRNDLHWLVRKPLQLGLELARGQQVKLAAQRDERDLATLL